MIIKILLLTTLIESVTILGRLLFGSIKNYYKKYRLKIRIHHGYIGILLILMNLYFKNDYLLISGASLFFSDAIHHFIVLPILAGRTEFP